MKGEYLPMKALNVFSEAVASNFISIYYPMELVRGVSCTDWDSLVDTESLIRDYSPGLSDRLVEPNMPPPALEKMFILDSTLVVNGLSEL